MIRHSLLFGVQNYPGHGSLTPLACPHGDVDALAKVFADPRYVDEVGQVVVVKDPTYGEARKHFKDFFRGVAREDVALIHFSGHGLRDDAGDLFLCFRDAEEDDLELTALNVARLGDWLEKKRLRRTLITLDCCYSGAAGAQMTRDSLASQLRAVERPLSDGTGLYILSSAGATETAKEGSGRGVFTHHLIEGIVTGEADSDKDGEITVSELAQYLQNQVPKDAIRQTPQLTAHKVSGTFAVTRNPVALEAEEARKAAVEAEERARARTALTETAVAKLKEHVAFGSINLDFAGAVQGWLRGHSDATDDHPRLRLLRDFGEGKVTAIDFYDRWRASEVHVTAAPDPQPTPRPETPQPQPRVKPARARTEPVPPPVSPKEVQPGLRDTVSPVWNPPSADEQRDRSGTSGARFDDTATQGLDLGKLFTGLSGGSGVGRAWPYILWGLFAVVAFFGYGAMTDGLRYDFSYYSSDLGRVYTQPPWLTVVALWSAVLGVAAAFATRRGDWRRRRFLGAALLLGYVAASAALEGRQLDWDGEALGVAPAIAFFLGLAAGAGVFFGVQALADRLRGQAAMATSAPSAKSSSAGSKSNDDQPKTTARPLGAAPATGTAIRLRGLPLHALVGVGYFILAVAMGEFAFAIASETDFDGIPIQAVLAGISVGVLVRLFLVRDGFWPVLRLIPILGISAAFAGLHASSNYYGHYYFPSDFSIYVEDGEGVAVAILASFMFLLAWALTNRLVKKRAGL